MARGRRTFRNINNKYEKNHTEEQIEVYKRKTMDAIDGLSTLDVNSVLQQDNIRKKYHVLANSLGMGENDNSKSRYAYFICNQNGEFFQLRIADHSSSHEEIYVAKERGRKPDFRCHILFERKTIVPTPINIPNVAGAPIIGVSLPWNILDSEQNINLLIGALLQLLQTGKFICPKFITDKADEITASTKSQSTPRNELQEHTIYNKNKIKLGNNMRRRIRLTENRLKNLVRIAIKESIGEPLTNEEVQQEIDRLIQQLKQKGYTFIREPDFGDIDTFLGEFDIILGHGYYIEEDPYEQGMGICHTDEDYTEPSDEALFEVMQDDVDPKFENGSYYLLMICLQQAVKILPNQNNVAEARRRRMVNAITESVIRRLRRR